MRLISAAAAELAQVLDAVMGRAPCQVCGRLVSAVDLQPVIGEDGPYTCSSCRRHTGGVIPQED